MKKIKCPHCGAENDVGAKTCDDCGRYLTGAKAVLVQDLKRGQCSWVSDGLRCCNPGTMTDSTTGSDTWYCAEHHGCTSGEKGHNIVRESMRYPQDLSLEARLRASIAKAEKVVPDYLRGWSVDEYRKNARTILTNITKGKRKVEGRYEWAEKILWLHKEGYAVPYITMNKANDRLKERAA